MKIRMLPGKNFNKMCTALLAFSAIGGASLLIVIHLKKQRRLLCAAKSQSSCITDHTAKRPTSHQANTTNTVNLTSTATSSEWERGLS